MLFNSEVIDRIDKTNALINKITTQTFDIIN
jgi:hypothetical protein